MDRNYRALTKLGATVLVIHHLGRDTTQDFRGTSDVKGSVDVAFKLTNAGDGARLSLLILRAFKQRFAVTPRLCVKYLDGAFVEDAREAVMTVKERLVDLLRRMPDCTSKEFERQAGTLGVSRSIARTFLKEGASSQTITVEPGDKNRKLHTWASDRQTRPRIGDGQ
jgi:hypothetical protein